ncbi:23S rRNA (guanosine2251-2-O)-methyltransferase [Trypanosoma grayi]|uniref:23S rRNA (guanosine2251-2-O)-methyltransferase n=1 Tax=Trypanosoma grayi TaxID=71804 RepID=UPI0004F4AF6E|nr:23S rRNA (guanosine2251-2-O)-methyltransferase [Trypanosoma grayi]KEG08234.1 23S rRNA (guanosine2251-2-O)-methyltransferase [Trypanosoma grayi]
MRSAFFLGVQRVVLSSDSAGCTAAVARASTGFVEHMEVYRSVMPTTAFLENTIAQHKARGDARKLCIYGATATPWRTAGQQRQQQQHQGEESGLPPRRLVLLGNEDKGLPLEVLRLCTHAVHVPSLRQREQRQQQQKQHQQHGRVEAVTSEGGGVGVKEQKAGEVLVENAATLRPQEVSLNVSAASAVVLVALLAGGQAVEVHPIQ